MRKVKSLEASLVRAVYHDVLLLLSVNDREKEWKFDPANAVAKVCKMLGGFVVGVHRQIRSLLFIYFLMTYHCFIWNSFQFLISFYLFVFIILYIFL